MVTIRRAEPPDAEATARVHVTAWQSAYRGLVPQGYLDAMEVDPQRVARWRDRIVGVGSAARTLVAVDADAVVGFVSLGPYRIDADADPGDEVLAGTGEVYAIYLDPDRLGAGIGRALMDAAVAQLREQGLTPIRLWVLSGNARAFAFYERYGFRPDGGRSSFVIEQPGELPVELTDVRLVLAVD